MLTIFLHSSKTMRSDGFGTQPYQAPRLLHEAGELTAYLRTLSPEQIATAMKVSAKVAEKTHDTFQKWDTEPANQLPAIDAFLGDIYSGLQSQNLSAADRAYADEHLLIFSGLYGCLRALDSIAPYRLEMDYRFPAEPYTNLYRFWGDKLASLVPAESTVINVSSVEYTKAVLPYLPDLAVITPKFMTLSASGRPVFVTVHAKIARGAFARWLIMNRVEDVSDLSDFGDLNYRYNKSLSTPEKPVFVCETFGGLGLSVRLS